MKKAPSTMRAAVASLLVGTALLAAPAQAGKADRLAEKAEAAMEDGKSQRAVEHAEAAVMAAPRDADLRVLLGKAYLDAGRMVSARDSFNTAVKLGDTSPRTGLMLALAQIGANDSRGAVATLDMQGTAIPAAERGLALALAGQPARGAQIIGAAIRAGDTSVKARQNLAYAFALDGRWREARMMAAQDVPADAIDQRIASWATSARPDQAAMRVANLLGTTAVADSGQPAALALVETPAPVTAAAPVAKPAPRAQPAPVVAVAAPVEKAAPVVAAKPANVAVAEPAKAVPAKPSPVAKPVETVAVAPSSAPRFVSVEVVQAVPAKAEPAAVPAKPAPVKTAVAAAKVAAKPAPAPATLPQPAASGSHIAQLGSFTSRDDAMRGWKVFQSRYSNLSGQKPVITKATIDGVDYYRVAAGGFDAQGANAMCRAVKASGHGCLPIASANGGSQRLAKAD